MNVSPEWKLLLASARTNLTDEDLQQITHDLVCPDLDWDHIVTVSYAQGIAPLIYHGLRRSRVISLIPAAAAEKLRQSYYANAARNCYLRDKLRNVLKLLKEQRIETLVLKGAALMENVYGDRALRPMADIDLLVRKEKLTQVEAQLLNSGYFMLDECLTDKEWRYEHHSNWHFGESSGLRIEVHWRIKRDWEPFNIDLDAMWQRAQPMTFAGIETLAFCPEDMLLHLCQHAWNHNLTGGLRPLCDITEVTKCYQDKIDWGKVAAVSSQWQMNPCLYLWLRLARDLLEAPIPDTFLAGLEPVNFNRDVIAWAQERILASRNSVEVSPDFVQFVAKGGSLKDRWTVLRKILSPSSFAPQNSAASFKNLLFYHLRIKELVTRYVPVVWGLITANQKITTATQKEANQQRLEKWLSSGL